MSSLRGEEAETCRGYLALGPTARKRGVSIRAQARQLQAVFLIATLRLHDV